MKICTLFYYAKIILDKGLTNNFWSQNSLNEKKMKIQLRNGFQGILKVFDVSMNGNKLRPKMEEEK